MAGRRDAEATARRQAIKPWSRMDRVRRSLCQQLAASLAAALLPARAGSDAPPLLFGLTAVILDEQVGLLDLWRQYLERRLTVPVRFVQRPSYREINDLLRAEKLDFAWLCGFPYVRLRAHLDLIAVPLYQGQPLYQSYIIVGAGDRDSRTLLDLRDKVFAFSDPDSNSGWLVPQVELRRLGEDARRFFRKTFYTWGHRKVVEAVAAGLADAGAVDGYIWDCLARTQPQLTAATRVIWRSPEYGFPPIVARRGAAHAEGLRQALLQMHVDRQGRALLDRLYLDGFTAGAAQLYGTIETNMRLLAG